MAERGPVAPAATGGDDETTTDGGSVVFVLSLTIEVMHILILTLTYMPQTIPCSLPLKDGFHLQQR